VGVTRPGHIMIVALDPSIRLVSDLMGTP